MDVTTVNNAVSDALAGLPAGTSSFISANIGTAAGQQAIASAGASLGLSNAQIAAAVNQVAGTSYNASDVAHVAAATPIAPASPAAPAAPASSFVGSAAPGAVGTNYGQASSGLISSAQQAAPDAATALTNGTARMTYDGDGNPILVDSKSGQQISGNYQIQVGQNGQIGINVPTANGAMVQVATKINQDGSIPAVTASNVLNAGVNQGAGGFAGGIGGMASIVAPAVAIIAPALIPYLAAYNAASAVNKKQYGAAILSAAVAYGGFNPDSALANALKTGADVPIDANGNPTLDSTQPVSGATTSPVYSPDVTGTPLSALDANAPVAPVTNVGTPISQVGNTNLAFNGTELTPAQVAANTNPINTSSLANGGVQNFGAGAITDANLAGMNTAYTGAMANGGFTSGYQTLPNGNRVMIQNDGTGIGVTPSGQSYALSTAQVQTLVGQGQLNSAASGYNTATGGTPTAPGGGTINTNGTTTLPSGAVVTTPLNSVASTSLLTPQNALIGSAALNTLGALNTNSAISNAANTQAQAGANAQNVITSFGQNYGQLQAPYQQTGVQATNALGSLGSGTYNIMNPNGTVAGTGMGSDYLTHQFNAKDLAAGLAPNYDFMLAQGQGANRNLANVGGGIVSGNTLQGLNKYTQDYAGNAYQNAFNNYQTQRQNIYSNLAGQAGIGNTSLGQLGSVGANLANTYGNVTTGLAASQAGATTAQAVNTQNALSNLGQTALLSSLIKPA